MTIMEELRSRNFSIYGQWTGVICIVLCFALGLANLIRISHLLIIIFAILCLVSAGVILFVEIPLLLRICPTSARFDAFIHRFETNHFRAAMYLVMSILQWLSLLIARTSLVAAAVFLLVAAACYGLASARGQAFVNSKTLGGQGVAQMIV